jgi:hypothetical protein
MMIETFDAKSEDLKKSIQSPTSIVSSIITLFIGIVIVYYGFQSINQPIGYIVGSLPLLFSIIIVIYSQLNPGEFFFALLLGSMSGAIIPILSILLLSLSSSIYLISS